MGANNKLGLPYDNDGKIQKVAICFDVDGTLIDKDGRERTNYTKLLVAMSSLFKGVKIVVWSGGGGDYAQRIVDKLMLTAFVDKVCGKTEHDALRAQGYSILAIDDIHDTRIGDINLIVRQ